MEWKKGKVKEPLGLVLEQRKEKKRKEKKTIHKAQLESCVCYFTLETSGELARNNDVMVPLIWALWSNSRQGEGGNSAGGAMRANVSDSPNASAAHTIFPNILTAFIVGSSIYHTSISFNVSSSQNSFMAGANTPGHWSPSGHLASAGRSSQSLST